MPMWRGKCAVRARYVLVPATALCISLLVEGSAGALKRCQNQDWPSDAFSELTIAHHPRQESERFWRSTQARCALSQVTRRMISDRSPLTRHRLSCALSIAEVRKAVPEQFRRSPYSYPAKQKFGLEADGDRATRRVFARKPDGSPILTIVSCCEPLMALLSHVA